MRIKHMNKNRKIFKYLILAVLCVAISACFSGCGKDEPKKEEKKETVVFKYGDNIVTTGEVYIYVCTVKERYEMQYGEDVWQLYLPEDPQDDEDVSMVDLTREEVVNEIVKVKTLVAHADEYNVKVSQSVQDELREKANTFYDGLTDKDIEKMELTSEKVYQVFYENVVAGMVEDKILSVDPIEISDEEARMTTFYDMYFPCYSIDANGAIVPYSEEECAKQYENALQACSTLATASIDENKDAENIENLAAYYKLEQAKEYTITPAEILEIYGEDVYNMLYSMENGDYSTVIESEYGYHVFQMIYLTDLEATDARKEIMTKDAVEARLSSTLDSWKKEIDSKFTYPESIDMNIYDTITIDE